MPEDDQEAERVELALYEAEVGDRPPQDALSFASSAADLRPQSSVYNQLAGYAWYMFGDEQLRDAKVKYYLGAALESDPKNVFARMYLGHQYFDTRQFKTAIDQFSQVDLSMLPEPQRGWRSTKMHELEVCCFLQVDPETELSKDLDNLYAEYQALSEVEAPVPAELARTCAELNDQLPRETRDSVMRILRASEFFEKLVRSLPALAEV